MARGTRLLSGAAAGLCFVNCTVLPALMAALPVASALPAESLGALHGLTHAVATYFAVPVGALAVATSHRQHGAAHVTAIGAAGVGLLAGAHVAIPGLEGTLLPHTYHAPAMLAGCAALLGSNVWGRHIARRQAKSCCGGGAKAPRLE